jgi:hypothetical protein
MLAVAVDMSVRAYKPDHIRAVQAASEIEITHHSALNITACQMALGCNTLGHIDSAQAREILFTALDRGVTLFDTAASYAVAGCGQFAEQDRQSLRRALLHRAQLGAAGPIEDAVLRA